MKLSVLFVFGLQGLLPQPAHTSYVSEEDEVVLEDNNCRIRLIFDEAAAAKGLRGATLATGSSRISSRRRYILNERSGFREAPKFGFSESLGARLQSSN